MGFLSTVWSFFVLVVLYVMFLGGMWVYRRTLGRL